MRLRLLAVAAIALVFPLAQVLSGAASLIGDAQVYAASRDGLLPAPTVLQEDNEEEDEEEDEEVSDNDEADDDVDNEEDDSADDNDEADEDVADEDGATLTTLPAEVNLAVKYADETVDDLNEQNLTLLWVDPSINQWKTAPKIVKDPDSNYLAASITQLGTYVVSAQ